MRFRLLEFFLLGEHVLLAHRAAQFSLVPRRNGLIVLLVLGLEVSHLLDDLFYGVLLILCQSGAHQIIFNQASHNSH